MSIVIHLGKQESIQNATEPTEVLLSSPFLVCFYYNYVWKDPKFVPLLVS